MHQKEHEVYARFQRYERFGMRWEEARLSTPERLRKAYDELVDAIANDRTPSPSPEAAIPITQNLEKMDTIEEHTRPKATTKRGFVI